MVDEFWRNGFVVLRRAFEPSEVLRWRERALQRNSKADLVSDPILSEVVLHPRLIEAAKAILGDDPLYFGNSYSVVGCDSIGGFHKDNSDRYDGSKPDWKTDRYPVIQFCLYCQPHGALPEGLDLLKGSHMTPDYTKGEHVSPSVEVGDVILFNSRTSHSANSMILKGGSRVRPNGLLWRLLVRLPRSIVEKLRRHHPQKRVMIGGVYAREHELTDRQIRYLNARDFGADCTKASKWPAEVFRIAKERGLKLLAPEERPVAEQTYAQHFEMA